MNAVTTTPYSYEAQTEIRRLQAEIRKLRQALSECVTDKGAAWIRTSPERRFAAINRVVAKALNEQEDRP